MKSCSLDGLVAATHTPFHADGSLAPEVVTLQADHLARHGIRQVFITGSTGEAHSLTRDERLEMFQSWSAVAPGHGMKVIAHVGSNCLGDARRFAAAAAGLGLDGVAALAPSYYKPATLGALVDWCAEVASAAPQLPFYYYDIPVLTGVKFPMADFLVAAAGRIPNLVGIKFTNDDLDAFSQCVGLDGGRFDIPWGIDERLVEALAAGARGAVGSSYNFAPSIDQELIAAFGRGEIDRARELQARAVEMIDLLAEFGYMGAAKAVMGWQGVPVGPARMPVANPGPRQLEQLRERWEAFVPIACP